MLHVIYVTHKCSKSCTGKIYGHKLKFMLVFYTKNAIHQEKLLKNYVHGMESSTNNGTFKKCRKKFIAKP